MTTLEKSWCSSLLHTHTHTHTASGQCEVIKSSQQGVGSGGGAGDGEERWRKRMYIETSRVMKWAGEERKGDGGAGGNRKAGKGLEWEGLVTKAKH